MYSWDFIEENDYLLRPSERKERQLEVIEAIESLDRLLKKNHLLIIDYDPECLNPVDLELDRIKKNLKNYDLFWEDLPVKINAKNAKFKTLEYWQFQILINSKASVNTPPVPDIIIVKIVS